LERPALDKAAGEEFLQEAFQILLEEAVRKGTDVAEKVCDWKEPPELRELLDLELRDHGEPAQRLLERCRDVIRYSVKTCERGGADPGGARLIPTGTGSRPIPAWQAEAAYTYEIAPVFVLMEEVVLAKLRELVGWSSGDGTFCPGGSISNMYAMNVARFRRFPESRQKGGRALPRLALFASQESHYSVQKGAAFLGIGTDNVFLVRADERGKMIPEELEKEIGRAKGEVRLRHSPGGSSARPLSPAAVPLSPVPTCCPAPRCTAAWGGSALLSRKHRHLLAGIER
ncbi:CSAD decarboxylase, partial [Anseranas semipalmata]|nr:CSAD decarboxylase [Anseranas semipalmata]